MAEISQKKNVSWSPTPSGEAAPHDLRGLKWFSDVKQEPVVWLWEPYIPRRKITILGGDPGQGKTFITTAISAAISRGEPLPGQGTADAEPANVLMLTGEDDPGDTIKPRLMSLEADQTRIALYDRMMVFDSNGLQKLRWLVEEVSPRLIVIDPIVAYLGAKMDMNRSNEVRPIFQALGEIARDFDAGILVVRHMRKTPAGQKSGKAIYNGMGSIDFTASVRSELQVDEDKHGIRYLNHIKTNNGPLGKSIKYAITDSGFHWGEMIDHMPISMRVAPTVSLKLKNEYEVKLFLHDLLSQHPDGLPASDVFAAAKAKGYGETKVKMSKKGIVITVKKGDQWMWMLDPAAPPLEIPGESVIE